jgi:hypothetical protein
MTFHAKNPGILIAVFAKASPSTGSRMTIFGIGLHLLIAIFFAIHAVRSGRAWYWLAILFMLPLLGSIAYFVVVFLPGARRQRGVGKAGPASQEALNPGREMRAAQQAYDLAPTAHNQVRLATALFDAGMIAQALGHYDACLRGPSGGDAEVGMGAARAKLANGQPQEAVGLLVSLRARQLAFRPEQVGLLLASAYAAAGRHEEAGREYEERARHFGSVETRAELALWAMARGEREVALRELKELEHARRNMSKATRNLHQDLFRRLDNASAAMR